MIDDPLKPSPSLLCKLGSIAVHAEEMFSVTGHGFDKIELEQRLRDSEVQAWLKAMGEMALVPLKRTIEDVELAAKSKRKAAKS